MVQLRVCCVLVAAALAGCAERPVAELPFVESQPKWETAAHWQDFAADTAEGLVRAAHEGRLGSGPFYVRRIAVGSAFGRAFRAMLEGALLARGASVAATPQGAIVVSGTVQPIPREDTPNRTFPGWATVAGGAAAAGTVYLGGGFGLAESLGTVGLGAAIDVLRLDQPTSEVVLTVAVMDGSTYAFSRTRAVYVSRALLREYASAFPAPAPVQPATGGAMQTPVTMIVVGPEE